MALYIDFHSKDPEEISTAVDNLTPISGTCLFIDIISSTQVKYEKGFKEWVLLLKNTFSILELQKLIKENTVKFIGDAVMIFISDEALCKDQTSPINDYYTLLEEIFATVDVLKLVCVDENYMKCRASVHYCDEVYNITFQENSDDYYGRGIDLCARLLSKSPENTIVFTEEFYRKVANDLKQTGRSLKRGCMKYLSGRYIENFKGIPGNVEFWTLNHDGTFNSEDSCGLKEKDS